MKFIAILIMIVLCSFTIGYLIGCDGENTEIFVSSVGGGYCYPHKKYPQTLKRIVTHNNIDDCLLYTSKNK